MADTVRIAVCDDEKNIRSYLVSLIRKQDIECSIMEYASADEYLADGRAEKAGIRFEADFQYGGEIPVSFLKAKEAVLIAGCGKQL